MVDFEAELALVVGRRCKHVPEARVPEVIAGFMCGNDVSVRDWQRRSPTMQMGKSFDTHGPCGPWITTIDEVGPEPDLAIRSYVDDRLMQDGRTGDLIYKIPSLIAHLTTAFTLEPGDVVFTGTPSGVGVARTPPVFLRPGNTVRVEIEGLGALTNPVIAEDVKVTID
jgi:2-keto-4-pentenoate hydratase/2-oxohepta-3-ene-1,7-dioic acid hydratase in catechol pathway